MNSMFGRRKAARVVVLDPADRVLLISAHDPARPDSAGWWEVPGGGIDGNETSESAVRRELWEEAGVADAKIGPCLWTQTVQFTFAGIRFDQDEWVHVARFDGTPKGPQGLEAIEAIAFGEQRWWSLEELRERQPRTIPYRLAEFLPSLLDSLADNRLPSKPIDITPDKHHIERWNNAQPP